MKDFNDPPPDATMGFSGGNKANESTKKDVVAKPPPSYAEDDASYLSKLFVFWMFPILALGRRNELTMDDLGPPAPRDDVEHVYERFHLEFEKDHLLLWALARLIRYRVLAFGLFLTALQAGLAMLVPFTTKLILNSLAGVQVLSNGELWGATLACVFLPFLGAVCQAHLLLLARRASLHMYISLTHAIFVKSLTKANLSIGRTTNLMAADAGVAMERSIQMLFPMFVAPVNLAILLWLLFRELGASVFVGIGTIALILPFNIFIFAQISKYSKRIMTRADHRLKLTNEFLTAIRVVKAYAWEIPLTEKIEKARELELKEISGHAIMLNLGLMLIFIQLANVMIVVVLWTYYGLGGVFSPGIIFPALQLFGLIQGPLSQLPNAISVSIQTLTAIGRIEKYLNEPDIEFDEKDQRFAPRPSPPQINDVLVSIANGTFAWRETSDQEEKRKPYELKNVNVELHSNELTAVVGRLSSGKTSFLRAILGEMTKSSGVVLQRGTVAFAQQEPFILNTTFRENILFGCEFDEERYFQCIDQCSLTMDLIGFKGGDMIQIGERGINLSGGQMARLSLARAIYAKSDVLLLDDVLAAVDAHVGEVLFNTLRESTLLKDRLVIFVTNDMTLLSKVDRVVALAETGEFLGCEEYEIMLGKLGHEYFDMKPVEKTSKEEAKLSPAESTMSIATPEQQEEDDRKVKATADKKTQDGRDRTKKERNGAGLARQASLKAMDDNEVETLFEEENVRHGELASDVFALYVRSARVRYVVIAVSATAIYMILPNIGQIILAQLTNKQVYCGNTNCPNQETDWYLGWFTFTILLSFVLCIGASLTMAFVRVRSARRLHHLLLDGVAHASVSFFDRTPIGRIANRFSKDIGMIDSLLSQFFMWICLTLSIVLGAIVSVAYSSKGVMLAIMVPVVFLFGWLFKFQRRGGAQLHRIEAVTRAPIFSLFAEVLNGRSTIRAYRAENRFRIRSLSLIRANSVPFFLGRTGLPAFLTMYLNSIGLILIAGVSIFVVFSNIIPPGDAGLALSAVGAIVQILYFTAFLLQDFELQLNAVERIDLFVRQIEHEAPWIVPDADAKPPPQWPIGQIEFLDVVLAYTKNGPDVLNHLSFTVAPQEKLGIVGRTGSGKSTLAKAILRIVEVKSGKIFIDGVDISQLGIIKLRQSVGIIPQEPVLFFETIRYNLDPFQNYTDDAILSALDLCGMGNFARSVSLDYIIAENSTNLSLGQRASIACARVLIRNPKILLMDEASASFDRASDRQLQHVLRTAFKHTTMLTIAHRLVTVADYDRIMVLSEGKIKEFDTPETLLKNESGEFASLVSALDPAGQETIREMASQAAAAKRKGL